MFVAVLHHVRMGEGRIRRESEEVVRVAFVFRHLAEADDIAVGRDGRVVDGGGHRVPGDDRVSVVREIDADILRCRRLHISDREDAVAGVFAGVAEGVGDHGFDQGSRCHDGRQLPCPGFGVAGVGQVYVVGAAVSGPREGDGEVSRVALLGGPEDVDRFADAPFLAAVGRDDLHGGSLVVEGHGRADRLI